MRLKGIYFITTSRLIDTLITVLKQVLKPKIVGRIRVFKSWDEIYDIIGKDIIPVDFGGDEKSEQEILGLYQIHLNVFIFLIYRS